MQRSLVIHGWTVEFNKINLTNTQRAERDYSLSEAKSTTDQVLKNQKVKISLHRDLSAANDVTKSLRELVAMVSIVD